MLHIFQNDVHYYREEKDRVNGICDELDEENENYKAEIRKLKAQLESGAGFSHETMPSFCPRDSRSWSYIMAIDRYPHML